MKFTPSIYFMSLLLLTFIGCKENSPTNNTQNSILPETPVLTLVDTSRTGNFIICWTASRRANSYSLQEDQDPTFSNPVVAYSGIDTTFRISNKPFGHAYYYRVKANNNEGSSGWSATKSVIVVQLPAPSILVTTATLDFGDVLLDTIGTLPLTVSNAGNSTLVVSNLTLNNASFLIIGSSSFSIAPGGNHAVDVQFKPTARGKVNATLSIASNDSTNNPKTVPLSGRGVTPIVAVSSDTLGFASFVSAGMQESQLIVSNAGDVPLQVFNIALSNPKYTISSATSFTISPAATKPVLVRLTSNQAGVELGVLTILTNDRINPSFSVSLQGRFFSDVTVLAGTSGFQAGGVFRSTNSGGSWSFAGLANLQIHCLVANNSGTIFAGTSNGVHRSTDNGVSWTDVSSGLTSPGVYSIAVNSSGHLFAATWGYVFRSINNGDSWTATGFPSMNASSVAINSSDHIFVGVTGSNSGIFCSTDNGDTWANLTSSGYVRSVAVNSLGHIFAGTESGVLRSMDNGGSWSQVNSDDVTTLIINSAGNLFAGTLHGVFRSTNNGSNWSAVNSGLSIAENTALAVYNSSDPAEDHLFTGILGNGVYRSVNNGETWILTNSGLTSTQVSSLIIR